MSPLSGNSTQLQLQPVKERRRLILDKWADLAACDVCQAKKVKCVRLDVEWKDCEFCRDHGVPCQNQRQTKHRYRKADKQNLIRRKSQARGKLSTISYGSTETGLHRLELSEFFMADLLASFFEHSDEQAPYVNYASLQRDFEQAGRRLQQLDPLTEPLVLAICASSSQYSDSRLLLGTDAPDIERLNHTDTHSSLVRFGMQRQALCEQLAYQAVELTAARGLFRKASLRSIQVVTMMIRVMRHPAPLKWKGLEGLGNTGRALSGIVFDHVRTLFAKHGAQHIDIGEIQWPLLIGDGCHSAIHGRSLQVSDEDLEIFPYMSGLPPPTPTLVRTNISSSNMKESMLPLLAIANELVVVSRKIAKSISIPLANDSRLPVTTFLDHIRELRRSLRTLVECQQVAKEMEALITPSILKSQKQKFGASMATSIRIAPLSSALLLPAMHKQFEIFKQRYRHSANMASDDGQEHLLRAEVDQEIELGLVEALSVVADAIRGIMGGKDKVASLTRQTSLYVPIQQVLSWYFDLAYDIPTIEQSGSSPMWTYRVKAQTLTLIIDALKLQTWAWSDREVEVRECEYRFKQFRQQVQEEQSLSTAYSHNLLSTESISDTCNSLGQAQTEADFPLTTDFGEVEWGLDYTDLWSRNV